MRVKKIMNWPLTIFTLVAIGVIIAYGSWLARSAIYSSWGREHIKYDQAADSLEVNIETEYNNRAQNMIYLSKLIERGICRDENDLMTTLSVVASSGQWDLYGYIGSFGVACDTAGKRMNLSADKEPGNLLKQGNQFFVADFMDEPYFFVSDTIFFRTERTQLFFAIKAERFLREIVEKSEVRGNAAAITDEEGNVIITVNMDKPLSSADIPNLQMYDNSAGTINLEYIEKLKEYYDTDLSRLLILTDDEADERIITSMEDNGEATVWNENPISRKLEHLAFKVKYEGEYIWYRKDASLEGFGDFSIYSGKPKELSSQDLESGFYIIVTFTIMFILLIFMFIMQIIFTVHSNKKLVKVAYIDPITKIRNWNRFVIDAENLLRRRWTHNYAMAIIDIDRFKVYNELYGHGEGDKLLRRISDYLNSQLRSREIMTRCGADHFTMLLINIDDDELHQRILGFRDKMKEMFEERSVEFTIGVNRMLDSSQTVDHIYTLTLFSQENSKYHRDMPIYYFCEVQRQMLLRENELENSMVSALRNKEYKVYLQPKYTTDGQKIGGAEALVRWISDKMGFISPGEFIPLFEKNGFVVQLDNYMLNEVCSLQKHWMDEGKELITISVNISRIHLMDPKLIDDVLRIVDSYGLPHSCIELELTESAFFEAKDVLIASIKKFQELGFEVSMDDFGSGYSSLNSLKDLPLNVIKLDGEFFKETEDVRRGTSIVTDTIQLAKHLNMKIVAEGIEKKEQVEFLKDMGCDLIQGFYFAKPMPVEEFSKKFEESLNR